MNTSRDSERVNQLLCVFTQRVQTASAQSRDPLKTHFMRLSSLLHPVHVSCSCMVGVPEADEHLKALLSAPPVFLHSQFNLSSNLHQRLVQSRSWMQHCLPEAKCTNYSFIQADLQLVISLHPFDFAGTAVYCVQKNNRHKTNCTIWYQLENEQRQRSVGKPHSEGIKPLQTGRGWANPGQSPAAAAEVSAEAPKLQKRVSQG